MIIVVKGKPQGKGRPRFTKSGHAYTPKNTSDYERQIRFQWAKGYYEKIQDKPVCVKVRAEFKVPKSVAKAKREALHGEPYLHKPDIDNIIKICLDALNGLAYADDRQIASVEGEKVYGEQERVTITINELKR